MLQPFTTLRSFDHGSPSNPLPDMTLNDLLLSPLSGSLSFLLERAVAFFPPQSPQDYIRQRLCTVHKAHRECEEGRGGNLHKTRSNL